MMVRELIGTRLRNHRFSGTGFSHPAQCVEWYGAVQAQDYLGALWALGVRTRSATRSVIEQALTDRLIVRTWPMRGTLHFVAAADVRWLVQLLAPRIIRRHRARLVREYGLDDAALARCRAVVIQSLRDGNVLTRSEVYARLERRKIVTGGQRGVHIVGRLAQEGLICFGPPRGKQQALVLLEEWLPRSPQLSRQESLAELARRYFSSHGPAMLADFVWWSGLTVREAQDAIGLAGPELRKVMIDGVLHWLTGRTTVPPASPRAHLLPPFDEFLVGYKHRDAVLDPRNNQRLKALLSPAIESGGKIVGTWRRQVTRNGVTVRLMPFRKLADDQAALVAAAAGQYAKFFDSGS